MHGYTVIDVETTGLAPEKHDRILELAVVYVSPAGEITGSWSTLINPQRDVGPTRIHGITAKDVASAPTFARWPRTCCRPSQGAPWSLTTPPSTFASWPLSSPAPACPPRRCCSRVCAPWRGQGFLAAPSRRLIDCCSACGIELTDAHSAAADALATAQLLRHYLDLHRGCPLAGHRGPLQHLPVAHVGGALLPTLCAHPYRDPHASGRRLARSIVARMPRSRDPFVESYLGVLELAMLDGYLAEHEKEQMVAVAEATGLPGAGPRSSRRVSAGPR